MTTYTERTSLQGFEIELFKLVSSSATSKQWKEWLRVPLEHAASRGNTGLFNKLLEAGADVNIRDERNCSLLHIAAGRGHDEIVSTLLLKGANKDALDDDGDTPLIYASVAGRLGVVKTLLAVGADFKIRNEDGSSALEYTAQEGHAPVIQAILGHGADINDRCLAGDTALHIASLFDQVSAVDALVEGGADIEFKNETGETPFLGAAQATNSKAMLALRQHGARLDVRDYGGKTPLHLACDAKRNGLREAVDLLLRWGADETALNNKGLTPAEMLDCGCGYSEKPASQDEIERTRLLLSRAPADRAWRRRGWLVMLRSRAEKARAVVRCDGGGIAVDGPSADGGSREDGRYKAARKEEARSGDGDHVVRRQATSRVGVDADDGDGNGGVLSGAVGLLVGLEVDGVFRTVLSFL